MNNNDNNKLLWIVIGLTVVMLVVGIGSKSLVNKISDRVIEKLQKEYSPSPYGPGIDPDKLDVEKLRRSAPPPVRTKDTGWDTDWQSQR